MGAKLDYCLAFFATIGMVVSRGAPPPLLESNLNPAHILTAYERGGHLTASPGGVFVVAQRWIMQCLVSKTGVDHWGDQTSWTDFKIITGGRYKVGGRIEDALPPEWRLLFLPGGFDGLQQAVDEAFDLDWRHDRQFNRLPGTDTSAEWADPLGAYYSTRILR